jgi:hypothetical protein
MESALAVLKVCRRLSACLSCDCPFEKKGSKNRMEIFNKDFIFAYLK